MSKKEETKYEKAPESPTQISAYGYGVYASSSNKKASILPLKSSDKKVANSYSLQAASSTIKKSIISALPKINKAKSTKTSISSEKKSK